MAICCVMKTGAPMSRLMCAMWQIGMLLAAMVGSQSLVMATGLEGCPAQPRQRFIHQALTPPAAGQRAMSGLNDDYYNAWFRISGPDYSTSPALVLSDLDRVITWNAKNKLQYWGPDKLTASFNTLTGGMSGSYTYKYDFSSVSFTGVLLQKQNLVVGKYGSQGKSGSFSVQKR